jgi:phosphomannomutase/phosphoglucomutase
MINKTHEEILLMKPFLNPLIFRAYDIRGKVGTDLTPDIALLIGKAFGTYIQKIEGDKIAIGKDNRTSSKQLQEAFIDGLLSTGCSIIDIGLSLSPMLYFVVAKWKLHGGVNVTGSHNPIEYNGFKLTKRDAAPVAEEEIQVIKQIIEEETFIRGKGKIEQKEIKTEYYDFLKSKVKLRKKIKVVVDAGNGIAGIYAPQLLREIGCDVIELYCESDGTFPHHLPDPEMEENLRDLKNEVINNKADIGFAYDGDGDRIGIVDEKGHHYESDFVLILLARGFLEQHPGGRVLFDVKCSKNVYDDIKAHGGIPFLYKTGHSLIKKKMREENILFGGEISGHMFFGENSFVYDDGIQASLRLLNILSKDDKRLSDHFVGLRHYFSTPEIKVPCPDEDKFRVVDNVSAFFLSQYPDSATIDGIRISFSNGWALVRASNTNPYLTVRIEADSEQSLQEIKKRVVEKLQTFSSVTIPETLKDY